MVRLSITSLLRFGIFANVGKFAHISDNFGIFLDEDYNIIIEWSYI